MKTICIYHSRDLDGWMSAAIVKKWFIENQVNKLASICNYEHRYDNIRSSLDTHNYLDMLGWDYNDPIPDLSEYNSVIMCDISFPVKEMKRIADKFGVTFTWIDHHQRTINETAKYLVENKCPTIDGLTTRDGELFAACELTWKHFFKNEPIPEIVRLLGRYDCFGHKETDEEQKVLEFQYGARSIIFDYNTAFDWLIDELQFDYATAHQFDVNPINYILEIGKAIYKYLCTEAKQTYKKAFEIELVDPTIDMYPPTLRFLCVNQERFNPINFNIDYHKDGYNGFACFWYKDNKWMFSLYNDNGLVDCSAIAKSFDGGGHKGASGFIVENINKFLLKYKL